MIPSTNVECFKQCANILVGEKKKVYFIVSEHLNIVILKLN